VPAGYATAHFGKWHLGHATGNEPKDQGGSPQGYSQGRQPWHNSAITAGGELRPDFMGRLGRILDLADELGMVAILGLFYFGQDERLGGEAAVLRAVDGAADWVLDGAIGTCWSRSTTSATSSTTTRSSGPIASTS
jgi:hypothetical protein